MQLPTESLSARFAAGLKGNRGPVVDLGASPDGNKSSNRQCWVWVMLLVGTIFPSGLVFAEEPSADALQELRQRIEQLEKDNRNLRSSVQKLDREPLVIPTPAIGDYDPSQPIYTAQNNLPPSPTEDSPLHETVEKYLRDRENRQAQADSVRDQKLSILEKGVKDIVDKRDKKIFPTPVTISGVFQADTGFFGQDHNSLNSYGDLRDGSDFRRARLGARGSVTEQTNYFFQMDFGFFGRPTFTDVWVEQTKIPLLGNVRAGQWKQPFSLEVVSSFRYTTFMERSVLFQAFTQFRHIGVGFYDNAEDLSCTWAASFFRTGQDQFGGSVSNTGGWGTSERVTWAPYYNEETNGREYLHLGFGHFFNKPPNNTVVFRTIPEMFVGDTTVSTPNGITQGVTANVNGTPFFVTTGNLTHVNNYNVLGTELLWSEGAFSFQSEAMINIVDQGGFAKTAYLPGMYAQAGYFLTGEHRPYDRKTGTIDRVKPFSNLFHDNCGCGTGYGAWEIAGRFSYLNLNDQNIHGGIICDYTFGLNWYLNPNTKVVFNYIRSITNLDGVAAYSPSPLSGSDPTGHTATDLYGMRIQVDF